MTEWKNEWMNPNESMAVFELDAERRKLSYAVAPMASTNK